MEFMQLEMFVAVIEERSVSKAAARVFRTQPAVCIALGKLEREIGTPLLNRSRLQKFRPTRAGRVLYEYAFHMLALRSEVLSVLQGKRTGIRGSLIDWMSRLLVSCGLDKAMVSVIKSRTGRPARSRLKNGSVPLGVHQGGNSQPLGEHR